MKRSAITRTKGLRRCSLKQKAKVAAWAKSELARRVAIKRQSKKGAARSRARAKLTAELITPGVTLCAVRSPVCTRWAQHLHHKRKSGQGGGDTRENCVPACDACNSWVEREPAKARAMGMVIKSYEPEPTEVM